MTDVISAQLTRQSASPTGCRADPNAPVETTGNHGKLWENQYKSDEHARFYAGKRDSSVIRRLSNYFEERMIRRSLQRIRRRHPFHTVLDCASGAGRFLPVLAEFGVRVVVLDTSGQMLEQGRRYHGLFGSTPAVIVGSADALPLPNQSMDVVLCSRLLHHLPQSSDRIRVLKELARVAAVGVVVTFFDACSWHGWRRSRKKKNPLKLYGRHTMTRAQCIREATWAGLTPIGMIGLLRFHTEITAAAFIKDSTVASDNEAVVAAL